MTRKFRKALRAEIKTTDYYTPSNGNKLYVLAYGSEPLYTYEVPSYIVMTRENAFATINELLADNGEPPKTNIKKVTYYRVA